MRSFFPGTFTSLDEYASYKREIDRTILTEKKMAIEPPSPPKKIDSSLAYLSDNKYDTCSFNNKSMVLDEDKHIRIVDIHQGGVQPELKLPSSDSPTYICSINHFFLVSTKNFTYIFDSSLETPGRIDKPIDSHCDIFPWVRNQFIVVHRTFSHRDRHHYSDAECRLYHVENLYKIKSTLLEFALDSEALKIIKTSAAIGFAQLPDNKLFVNVRASTAGQGYVHSFVAELRENKFYPTRSAVTDQGVRVPLSRNPYTTCILPDTTPVRIHDGGGGLQIYYYGKEEKEGWDRKCISWNGDGNEATPRSIPTTTVTPGSSLFERLVANNVPYHSPVNFLVTSRYEIFLLKSPMELSVFNLETKQESKVALPFRATRIIEANGCVIFENDEELYRYHYSYPRQSALCTPALIWSSTLSEAKDTVKSSIPAVVTTTTNVRDSDSNSSQASSSSTDDSTTSSLVHFSLLHRVVTLEPSPMLEQGGSLRVQ